MKKHQSFLIGIGGTGGHVLREFRKQIFAAHDGRFETDHSKISYLYIDSSKDDLDSREKWMVWGDSVALDEGEKALIGDADLSRVLDNLNAHHGIRPWIGDKERIKNVVSNSTGTRGANQIRRFGRFLLASNADRVKDAIRRGVDRLQNQEGGEGRVDFHLFFTTACGTGSGSIIDVISLIRSQYPDGTNYRIFLYGFITSEEFPKVDVGNFHANQYALLSELNSLRLGQWNPHNLYATDHTDDLLRLKLKDNFNVANFISNMNQNRRVASIEDQIRLTASYIFMRIVAWRGEAPRLLKQADSFEDAEPYHENNERSYFFGSFGINRLIYPEKEIREKLMYLFAEQVIRQLQFNNLVNNEFVDEAKNWQFRAHVRQQSLQEHWCLTDDHLMLSLDFMPLTPNPWDPIEDEWAHFFRSKREELESTPDKGLSRVQTLETAADGYYRSEFRDEGAPKYFKAMKERHLVEVAENIASRVEQDLFNGWENGQEFYGLNDIAAQLGELHQELIDRHEVLSELKTQTRQEMARHQEVIAQTKTHINETGWIGRAMRTHRASYTQVAKELEDYYVQRTRVDCAIPFAIALASELAKRIGAIKNSVDDTLAGLKQLATEFRSELNNRLSGTDGAGSGGDDKVVVENSEINEKLREITCSGTIQKEEADGIREQIIQALGTTSTRRGFRTLADTWPTSRLRDLVIMRARESSKRHHDRSTQSGLRKVIGVNVIEYLFKKHNRSSVPNQALKDDLTSWLQLAATQVYFDSQQPQPRQHMGNKNLARMPRKGTIIFLPKCDGPAANEFRENLKKFLSNSAVNEDVGVVDTEENEAEVTAVSVSYWFALRFLETVHDLKKKYDDSLKGRRDDMVQKVHLEDGCEHFPDLLLPTDEDERKLLIPRILLCAAGGYMETLKDPSTGKEEYHIIRRRAGNEGGLGRPEEHYPLECSTWCQLNSNPSLHHSSRIRVFADQHVCERSRSDAKHREKLAARLEVLLDEIYEERGRSDLDPIYREFTVHKEKALSMIAN